jgi:hypothetical protein
VFTIDESIYTQALIELACEKYVFKAATTMIWDQQGAHNIMGQQCEA